MPKWTRAIPVCVVAAASAMISIGVVSRFLNQSETGDWSSLPGTITKVEVIPGAGVDGRWLHKLDIEYSYDANGVPYTGTRVTTLGELSVWLRGGPASFKDRFRKGQMISVYVPKGNATEGILEPGLTQAEMVVMGAGGGLPALLTLLMLRSLARTFAEQSDVEEHKRMTSAKETSLTANPFNRALPEEHHRQHHNPFGVRQTASRRAA